MRSWTTPTPEQINAVRLRLAKPTGRTYFFDRLENPNWVGPLSEIGAFADPPPAVRLADGRVQFPPWPEGRYLQRIAAESPDAVGSLLLALPSIDNPAVAESCLACVAELPDEQVLRLSKVLKSWIATPNPEFFVREAGAAITRLLAAGKVKDAVSAARTLLALLPDPKLREKLQNRQNSGFAASLDVGSRLGDWQYKQSLAELVEPITAAAGMGGVRMVASLLRTAMDYSDWPEEGRTGYGSLVRPAIEDHPQNFGSNKVLDALISALRDASVQYAGSGDSEAREVVDFLLGGHAYNRRIAVHIVAHSPYCLDLLSEWVASPRVFDLPGIRHEFAELLRNRFDSSGAESQAAYLAWVKAGPDLDAFVSRSQRLHNETPTREDLESYAERWRLHRYSYVREALDPASAAQYEVLLQRFDEPEHPDFDAWHTSWVGPESPKELSELGAMPLEELLRYLRDWTPESESPWHLGPSREGLGRSLAETVQKRPLEFSIIADDLKTLDPTYVRNIIEGWNAAAGSGEELDWAPVLRLINFIAAQPFEAGEVVEERDRDPGWEWTRRQVSTFLKDRISGPGATVPIENRSEVWSALARLTLDPNPSPDFEHRFGGDNMDPLTLSLNANRSSAMHAVIQYALWIHQQLNADESDEDGITNDVVRVLDAHLNPDVDPSLAVRAVYGRWLPWLVLIDPEWVSTNSDRIFPDGSSLRELRLAAWDSYVTTCRPYDSVYAAIGTEYARAVEEVSHVERTRLYDDPDANLGEHLVILWTRDVVEDLLLARYFARADDRLTGHVMSFVGRLLSVWGDEGAGGRQDRIRELWDVRVELMSVRPADHPEELAAFAHTFESEKLDPVWSLATLERILLIGADVKDYLVGDVLVRHAQRDPAGAARVLALLLKNVRDQWTHFGLRDEALRIVRMTIDHDAATSYAREIVGFYVDRGDLEFRTMLTGDGAK